jgi:hypothetical protein
MLRIALILALLAAIGGVVVSQFVTKPNIEELRTNLQITSDNLQRTQTELASSRQKEQEATETAERLTRELTETRGALEVATRDLRTQRSRADRLDTDLNRVTLERNNAQAELARWEALGVRPEQVRELRAEVRSLKDEKSGLQGEIEIFNRQVAQLQARLLKYEEPSAKVPLPEGLRGTVVAVSPQNDFVVLDIGESHGLLPRGELLVRRGDRLVGKVRVVSVEGSRSVANILPEWSAAEMTIQASDVVLY